MKVLTQAALAFAFLGLSTLNLLQELIELPQLLVAHLVQFALVQLLALPHITFQLLCIQLPFSKESDLASVRLVSYE